MIDMKVLGKSAIVAVVIAIIVATTAHFFFRDWAQENSLTLAIILGGIGGVIYPVVARNKRA
jgi:hypothetical protein